MNRGLTFIATGAVGAGAMFLLDPERGRRRRSLVRDKLASATTQTTHAVRPAAIGVRNRAYGTMAEAKSAFRSEDVSDQKLVARVRSELGRYVSHPRSIEVAVLNRCVTLSGPVLASEEDQLVKAVSRVRGVEAVDNRLEVHDQADNVPGLQGEPRTLRRRPGSSGSHLLSTIAGALLGMYGAQRRDLRGLILSALGLGLFARAASKPAALLGSFGATRGPQHA